MSDEYLLNQAMKNRSFSSLNSYRQAIRTLLEQEAKQVNEHGDIAELKYLKPWSHFRRFPEEVLNHIIDVLTGNVLSDWEKRDNYFKVRAALGHQGDRQTIDHLDKKLNRLSTREDVILHDKFLASLPKDKLEYFGQVIRKNNQDFYYFISHSAMRTWEWLELYRHQVFLSIYEYSYKQWIMDRKILKYSKFGRY